MVIWCIVWCWHFSLSYLLLCSHNINCQFITKTITHQKHTNIQNSCYVIIQLRCIAFNLHRIKWTFENQFWTISKCLQKRDLNSLDANTGTLKWIVILSQYTNSTQTFSVSGYFQTLQSTLESIRSSSNISIQFMSFLLY